jgi:ATP-dependent helicase/DNAse subunit B
VRRDKVESDPFSLGVAVHRVLELYHGREQAHGLDENDRKTCMEDLIVEVFDRMEEKKPHLCGEINFWRILRGQSRRILLAYVEWDSLFRQGFQPTCVELSIGLSKHDAFAEQAPALEIEEPGKEKKIHRFNGKIDRVDVEPEAKLMRAWDYKYASNRNAYREKLKPESLGVISFQVPLYLLAAKRHLSDTHQLEVQAENGGFILLKGLAPHGSGSPEVSVKNRTLEGDELWRMLSDPDYTWTNDRGEMVPGFRKRLFETIGSIQSGNFTPRPHAADICAWCSFSSVCRNQASSLDAELSSE